MRRARAFRLFVHSPRVRGWPGPASAPRRAAHAPRVRHASAQFAGDTRYDALAGAASVATHDGAAAAAHPVSRLADAEALIAGASVVGVDEAQFFEDVAERAEAWAAAGRVVICAGLDATFHRTAFPTVLALIPKAEAVTKLTAVCAGCGGDAAFTLRTARGGCGGGDAAAHSGALIGGAEAYSAACRECFAAATAAAAAAAADAPAEMAEESGYAAPPAVPSPTRAPQRLAPHAPAPAAPLALAGSPQPQAQPSAAKKARPGSGGGGAKRAFGSAGVPWLSTPGAVPLAEGLSRLELVSSPMATAAADAAGRTLLRSMR